MNNELVKRAKHHRRKQKGLPALSTLKTNAGNVEYNVMMFNKMNSPTDSPNTNPISGPMGGDVSVGMGESLTEELTFNQIKELIKELFDYMRSNRSTRYMIDDIYPSSSQESTFIIPIYNGDWKHEHLFLDDVVEKWLRRKGYKVKMWKGNTEDSGTDTFSADHYFQITGEVEPVKYEGDDPQNVANHLGTKVISDGVVYTPDENSQLTEDTNSDVDMFEVNGGDVTLFYSDVTIAVQGPKRDADDWDEWEVDTDTEYTVEQSDIIDYLYTIATPEELPSDDISDEELEEFWNDNFEKLLRKYQTNVLEYYYSEAAMDAEENYTEDLDDDFDMSTRSLF